MVPIDKVFSVFRKFALLKGRRYMTVSGRAIVWIILASSASVSGQVRTSPPLLVDGHVHITDRVYWEGIDPWKPQPFGDWDYARARQSGVNVVIENIAPYGYNTYNTTVKQVGRLIETFHHVLEANPDKMELALTSADVRRIVASGRLAVIIGIESGFDQEGDIDILRLWYRLGVRLIQFSSQVTNSYADSSVRGEAKWNGINDRGRRLIAEMNRLGIMIDIAHATEAAQRQIIEASKAPVVDSHTAMRAVCDNPANMSDDILRALAAKGGLVGIHSSAAVISQRYYDWTRTAAGHAYLSGRPDVPRAELALIRSPDRDYGEYIAALDTEMGNQWRRWFGQRWPEAPEADPLVPTEDEWAAHVEHVVRVAGPTHVAIGLDLTTARSTLKNFDARGYPRLIKAIRKRNLPDAVLGENWLRAMDAAKAP
jgi:membrane dipeptidase